MGIRDLFWSWFPGGEILHGMVDMGHGSSLSTYCFPPFAAISILVDPMLFRMRAI